MLVRRLQSLFEVVEGLDGWGEEERGWGDVAPT